MNGKRIALSWVGMLLLAAGGVAGELETPGVISAVTVYRGQALVTRALELDLAAGGTAVVVRPLPEQVVGASLHARGLGDTRVLSVRFARQTFHEDATAEVDRLEAELAQLRDRLHTARRDREQAVAMGARYQGLWQLAGKLEQADFDRGLLQAEALNQLSTHLEERCAHWHDENVRLELLQDDLEQALQEAEERRGRLSGGRTRHENQATVFVTRPQAGVARLELSYLVEGASWSPQYNLRARPESETVTIEYNAIVNQASGEDWSDVALTLSTAEPAMVAAPPTLEPLNVALTAPAGPNGAVAAGMPGVSPGPFDQAQAADFLRARTSNARKGRAAQMELNQLALGNQLFELNTREQVLMDYQRQLRQLARLEAVSVSYALAGRQSLPHGGRQHLLTIVTEEAPATFTFVATPLLSDYVYLWADAVNASDTIFLPGPAKVFRGGEFAGQDELPLVTAGQRFGCGFGIDSQLKVTRSLIDKTTRIQGGNRIETFEYAFAVENYKQTAVPLRLLDRLPHSDNSAIKIELVDVAPSLSTDDTYLRTQRAQGMLRWDLEAPARAGDGGTPPVSYTLRLEYDRNMALQPVAAQ